MGNIREEVMKDREMIKDSNDIKWVDRFIHLDEDGIPTECTFTTEWEVAQGQTDLVIWTDMFQRFLLAIGYHPEAVKRITYVTDEEIEEIEEKCGWDVREYWNY
jgi:hypothetical protein